MESDKVLAISGKPGLYTLKKKTRSGFVVESVTEGKTIIVNMSHNISVIDDISIYTYSGEVPLKNVFKKIAEKEDGQQAINHKVKKQELIDYFVKGLPEYDEDRVYASDIKKVIQWYNILVKADMIDQVTAVEEEE